MMVIEKRFSYLVDFHMKKFSFLGRLVIDHECRTNDPYIYAAGTLTKYSRRYLARTKAHKYYNRTEIGQRLGLAAKRMLSPKSVSTVIFKLPFEI